jgi:hypothetical protein
MNRRILIACAIVSSVASTSAFAATGAEIMAKLNHDKDQTLEMPEIIDAGADVFKSLNTDGDLTLDRAELAGRITEADWAAVNKDHDKTLELDEWLAIVRKRFDAADTKHTGKLDAAELDTPAGQKLVQMIVK